MGFTGSAHADSDGITAEQAAMAEKSKYSELIKCEICADYNGDGTVNVRDAAQLANAIATGKIDTSGN